MNTQPQRLNKTQKAIVAQICTTLDRCGAGAYNCGEMGKDAERTKFIRSTHATTDNDSTRSCRQPLRY